MLITILESDLLVDYVTEKEVVGYLTWCQEVLQSGLWPQKGYKGEALSGYRWQHRGESLAGPWRGAFSLWKGDLKAKVQKGCSSSKLIVARPHTSVGACKLLRFSGEPFI